MTYCIKGMLNLLLTDIPLFFLFTSLIATIKAARPDLLNDISVSEQPIPSKMPLSFRQPNNYISGVGEPTNACFLVDDKIDPTGWYIIYLFIYLFIYYIYYIYIKTIKVVI